MRKPVKMTLALLALAALGTVSAVAASPASPSTTVPPTIRTEALTPKDSAALSAIFNLPRESRSAQPSPSAVLPWGWGVCSWDCDIACANASYCPLDPYGHPQQCLSECP
jgi:hypothetical protein